MRVIFLDVEWRELVDRWRQGDSRRMEHTAASALHLIPQ